MKGWEQHETKNERMEIRKENGIYDKEEEIWSNLSRL